MFLLILAHLLLHRRVHDRRAVQVSAEPPRVARRDQVEILGLKILKYPGRYLADHWFWNSTFRWHPGRHQELSRRWQPEVSFFSSICCWTKYVSHSTTAQLARRYLKTLLINSLQLFIFLFQLVLHHSMFWFMSDVTERMDDKVVSNVSKQLFSNHLVIIL